MTAVAYGLFRFGHEWLRDTPRLWHGMTMYQGFSLLLVLLGALRFMQRAAAAGAGAGAGETKVDPLDRPEGQSSP